MWEGGKKGERQMEGGVREEDREGGKGGREARRREGMMEGDREVGKKGERGGKGER